jgi:hypothetical protein
MIYLIDIIILFKLFNAELVFLGGYFSMSRIPVREKRWILDRRV